MDCVKKLNEGVLKDQRIRFAKLKLYTYPESFFIPLQDLLDQRILDLMDWIDHGLNQQELYVVLCELFDAGKLLAWNVKVGFFNPSRIQIEDTLAGRTPEGHEDSVCYGVTNIGHREYKSLRNQFEHLLGVII